MPFKTITIKQDVYKELIKEKKPDESFSELFERMIKDKHPNLMNFYGAWNLKKGEKEKIENSLKKEREKLEESWKSRTGAYK